MFYPLDSMNHIMKWSHSCITSVWDVCS